METLVLWTHALVALLFAALGLWVARPGRTTLPRGALLAALGAIAIWALALAGLGGGEPGTRVAETVRNIAMLSFMFALHRRVAPGAVGTVYGVVAIVMLAGTMIGLAATGLGGEPVGADLSNAAILLRMMTGVAALVLLQNLGTGHERADVRIVAVGLAIIWAADLGLAGIAYVAGHWPAQASMLRGVAMALAAAVLAGALQRERRGPIEMSRTVAYRSVSLVAVGGYFALLAIVTSALGAIGGEGARIWQTAFVFGSAAAVFTLVSTPWLRAWAKVAVAKHFFRHRYDYRSEWIRFTATLGTPDTAASLDQRVVKAVADLTDSPAGLLLVGDGQGLGIGASWNWPADLPANAGDAGFVAQLGGGDWVIELDRARRSPDEAKAVPPWLLDQGDAWAVVPLLHLDRLGGAIVLARPQVDRALDWEDFDLLKVAGRQVASYLAEARARDALAETERFDEFNRRFAFIVHDIKNLVSGLSLVARNAERHADNPAFRADMVATLQDSAAKMNSLLARLSANHRSAAEPPAPIDVRAVAQRVATRRRASHRVTLEGARSAVAVADPARLEQVIEHLVQNAIEASPPAAPVVIAVSAAPDAVTIAVADRGCGMAPAFVRDQLFRPFVSSKAGGFGIGAFEARQLTEAMGGRIEVDSREGSGTVFRVTLPAHVAGEWDVAA